MSTVLDRERPLPSSSAPRRPLVRLEPVEQRRRSRVSEIVVGVVVVAACGLGTVLWQASSSTRERVLVLAHPVKAGEPLTSGDLTVGDVHLGNGVDAVPANEARRVLAHVAVADMPAGTLVAPALFVDRPALPAGARIVGVALAPAELPTFDLRSGQKVDIVGTTPATVTAAATGANAAAPTPTVLASDVEIWQVKQQSDTAGTWVVSLVVPQETAATVAAAAAAKQVRLAVIPEASS